MSRRITGRTLVFPCSVNENCILEKLIFCMVNVSAVFRSEQNESKCSEEGDCYVSVAGGCCSGDVATSVSINEACGKEI